MIGVKQLVLRFFFAAEVIFFVFFYFYGQTGMCALVHMQRDYSVNKAEIVFLQQEIIDLKEKIKRFQENSFYIEKKAREQLHMAREEEEVFFIE